MPAPTVDFIIPARIESTRLPRKILLDLLGKPMIQWVWEAAKASRYANEAIVATDSPEIEAAVKGFGGRAIRTGHHPSGTDRIAEAARQLEADVVVNVQGDQPLLDPVALDRLVEGFLGTSCAMGTLVTPMKDESEYANPERVKVVGRRDGRALYFSRAPIPFHRDGMKGAAVFKHIGVYIYRREFLLEFTKLERTALEIAESLEQLRALEHGYDIALTVVDAEGFGVETADDMELAKAKLRAAGRG